MMATPVLGVAVAFEVVLLHHRQHPLPRRVGHIGAVVEHPRYGPHGVAGELSDIFDGHPIHLHAASGHAQPLTAPATTPLMMCFCPSR